jgi:hypothetical protein
VVGIVFVLATVVGDDREDVLVLEFASRGGEVCLRERDGVSSSLSLPFSLCSSCRCGDDGNISVVTVPPLPSGSIQLTGSPNVRRTSSAI